MMQKEIKLTVKNKKGETVKEVTAHTFSIYYGTIDKLMSLLDLDDATTSFEILKKVTTVWGEVTEILGEMFPDMEPSDWDYVKINDLVPIVLQVIRYTLTELMEIPSEKN